MAKQPSLTRLYVPKWMHRNAEDIGLQIIGYWQVGERDLQPGEESAAVPRDPVRALKNLFYFRRKTALS